MDDVRRRLGPPRPLLFRLAAAIVAPALVTTLALLGRHPPTGVMTVLYLLAVVVAARAGGAFAGIAASFLSFLLLNFFFTRPLHTFVVATGSDLLALSAFLVTSVIVGLLLSTALAAKTSAERRELEGYLLNRLATRLLMGESTETVLTGFANGLCDAFRLARCEIVSTFAPPVTDTRSGEREGLSHDVDLSSRSEQLGTIRLWTAPRREPLDGDEQRMLESLATQLALALEGMRLSDEVRRAERDAEASQLKAALFAGVSHDVKTPLSAIMAAVTSLQEGRDFSEEEHRDHLETIKQEAERLHRVVNNLLDLGRLRADALIPTKVLSPIDELLESVVNRLRPLLGTRPIEIRVADDVPDVPMDVVQMDQLLTNLIENAIKFSPPDTPIYLSAVGDARGVRVTVADRGPGIPAEDRARIFEPFERGTTTTTGTGLGLAIANAIVTAHGGRMWIADVPAGGAAFTFELPCDPRPAGEVMTDGEGARR